MPNLIFKEYKKGTYVGWSADSSDTSPGDFCYNYDRGMASYFANLKPNTTYTIKRIDTSTRMRVGFSNEPLYGYISSDGSSSYISNIYKTNSRRIDSNDPYTFTTNDTDIYLQIYFTNNSEFSTRVMLNEGTTIEDYVEPTEHLPSAWYIDPDEGMTQDIFPPLLPEPLSKPFPPYAIVNKGNDGFGPNEYASLPDLGAFANASELTSVKIPSTCKLIGITAFRNTKLTSVRLPDDCQYYPTSFPDGCVVNGGSIIKKTVYLKWHITKRYGWDSAQAIQVAEFEIYDKNDNKIPISEVVYGNLTPTKEDEGLSKLIDGDLHTKYCSTWWGGYETGNCVLIMKCEVTDISDIKSYSYFTPEGTAIEESQRDPVSWTLGYASNQDGPFITISTVEDATVNHDRLSKAGTWYI